jgi:hypothetical protein
MFKIRVAAIAVSLAALVVAAEAGKQGGHGGGRSGGAAAHGGGHAGGFRGGSAGRSVSFRGSHGMGRSFAGRGGGVRAFRFASVRSFHRGGRVHAGRIGMRRAGLSRSFAGRRGLRHSANIRAARLHAANFRAGRIHADRFRAAHFRPFLRHGRFFGWYGPLFWPYAYDDIFYYAFWPYGYDDPFWYYGYGDIYTGLFSPYGYDDLVGLVPGGTRLAHAPGGDAARNAPLSSRLAQMCGEDTRDIAGLPIERMQQAVEPDDAQRAMLDQLGNASVKAREIIKAACPAGIALTPTGRLDAMDKRLDAMAQAVETVRPALEKFYDALSDEQKARLNAIGTERSRRGGDERRRTARPCGEVPAGVGQWPAADIERAVHPTQEQRASLDALQEAAAKAAETIKAACPTEPLATPPARLAAVGQRVQAMHAAVNSVRGALAAFYGSLSDEQKARFNTIGRSQAGRGQG